MRAGWKTITLNDACVQMNGIWKGTKEPLVPAKVLRTTNFSKDCRIKLDDLAIIDVEKKKLDARRLQRGDIIVEKSGGGPKQPVGRVILFDMDDDDYSFCNFTSALRIKDKEQLDYNYLHKYLTYLYFDGETEKYQSNLVGFRNLDFKGYVGIEVPYPSLAEQQRIVDILDQEFAKIDALKANAEKSLQAAKDLFQATLKKELEPKEGWETNTLSSIGKTATGTTPSTSHKEYYGDFIPFIKPADINIDGEGGLCYSNEGLSEEGANNGRVFQENSILMVCIGASIGKVGYALCPVSSNQQINILTPSKEYHWKFLYYCMASPDFQHKVIKEGESAKATLPIINKSKWERLTISTPNFTEQERIIAHLDDLNNRCNILQENYQKTLTLCDDLKQALLRKAFNGEL